MQKCLASACASVSDDITLPFSLSPQKWQETGAYHQKFFGVFLSIESRQMQLNYAIEQPFKYQLNMMPDDLCSQHIQKCLRQQKKQRTIKHREFVIIQWSDGEGVSSLESYCIRSPTTRRPGCCEGAKPHGKTVFPYSVGCSILSHPSLTADTSEHTSA
ncbi:uncharacterized protein LOC117713028 [Arvicanthis niloticus]|uniref:uncharacterized protein LOC117713028 n=1 Tax=Arvicanthis niloticus TaxID=61156 RepID=UPI00402BC012